MLFNRLLTLFAVVIVAGIIAYAQIFIPHAYWDCKTGFGSVINNNSADFTLGTFSNTNVSGTGVQLSTGKTSGTYTSKVLDMYRGCGPINTWTGFEWKTPLPFGKELPTST
ncbi:MAG: hypothetical protein ACXWQQ_06730 [Pseudobdellovibrio sp.]